MGWVETTLRPSASADGTANGTATRLFIIDGAIDAVTVAITPQNILGGVTGSEPLPRIGSAHPKNPRMFLDRYDVQADGATLDATAQYSHDGRFQFPNPPREQTEDEVRYSAGKETVQVDIPVIVQQIITQALPPQVQGPPEPFDSYGLDVHTIHESRLRELWTVLLKENQLKPALAAMKAQDNCLHFFDGSWKRFTYGDIVGSGNKDFPYQTTYTWFHDDGTNPDGSTINLPPWVRLPDQQVNHLPNSGPPLMLRPPFHELIAARSNDATVPPNIGSWIPYKIVPNGWASLVGLP